MLAVTITWLVQGLCMHADSTHSCLLLCPLTAAAAVTHPMVVIKLGVKESSENRSSMQLLPTPASSNGTHHTAQHISAQGRTVRGRSPCLNQPDRLTCCCATASTDSPLSPISSSLIR